MSHKSAEREARRLEGEKFHGRKVSFVVIDDPWAHVDSQISDFMYRAVDELAQSDVGRIWRMLANNEAEQRERRARLLLLCP